MEAGISSGMQQQQDETLETVASRGQSGSGILRCSVMWNPGVLSNVDNGKVPSG